MDFKAIISVALGGALGATLRFGVGHWINNTLPKEHHFWGTVSVNLLGCFGIGIAAGLLPTGSLIKLALVTGFLGALTTFSTFGLEANLLAEQNRFATSFLYVVLQVLAGLTLVKIGMALTAGSQ